MGSALPLTCASAESLPLAGGSPCSVSEDDDEGSSEEEEGSDEADSDDEPKSKVALGKRKAAPQKPPKKKPEKKPRRMYSSQVFFHSPVNMYTRWPKSGSGVRTRDGDCTPHEGGSCKLVARICLRPFSVHSTSWIVDAIYISHIPQSSFIQGDYSMNWTTSATYTTKANTNSESSGG